MTRMGEEKRTDFVFIRAIRVIRGSNQGVVEAVAGMGLRGAFRAFKTG